MFAQIIAICIFVTMFLLIILDKFERHYITLGSGALVLVLVFGVCMRSMSAIWETLNLGAFFQSTFWYGASEESTAGINWSTILFIAGMMIMVEGLGKAGFFRWLCLTLAKLVHYRTVPLLICFMSLSAFLSMFIDSITVVLFLATVTLELAQTMKFDPVPMILSEIFCANLGGAATMCGDPPNIIIGTSLGYTFFDFIENTGAVVAICFVFMLIYFTLCFRKELERAEHANGRHLSRAFDGHHEQEGISCERRRFPAGGRAAHHARADGAFRRVHRRDRRDSDADRFGLDQRQKICYRNH